MADGVDHIDIYADVGEEFNQVRKGLGARRRSGRRCGRGADPGPPRAASRRGCRQCACASCGPSADPSAAPPRRSFYGVVTQAAGPTASAGPGARPPGLARGENWAPAPLLSPPPPPRRGGRPAERAPPARRVLAFPLGPRCLALLHFVPLSMRGRLMEGRAHGPLYPARPVSWALLPAFAPGFGLAPSSCSLHTFPRRLRLWARSQQVLRLWDQKSRSESVRWPCLCVGDLQCL